MHSKSITCNKHRRELIELNHPDFLHHVIKIDDLMVARNNFYSMHEDAGNCHFSLQKNLINLKLQAARE